MKEENKNEQVQRAYTYLVKTPSSNDVAVCACNSVLVPGTKVVAPTRYGLDLGVVIGSASSIGMEYTPGCSKCVGACHFEPTNAPVDEDDDLAAAGDVQVQSAEQENIVFEADGKRLTLGPLPAFEFVAGTFSTEGSRQEEKAWADKEAKEEKSLWDKAYRDPELVEVDGDVTWIDHVATADEVKKYEENQQAELDAICVCRDKIEKLGLNMKLVTAHFLLCEPKVLFSLLRTSVWISESWLKSWFLCSECALSLGKLALETNPEFWAGLQCAVEIFAAIACQTSLTRLQLRWQRSRTCR